MPIGGGHCYCCTTSNDERNLLQQLIQWKVFTSKNDQEEKEDQQYLMDLIDALVLANPNLLPKTLNAQ